MKCSKCGEECRDNQAFCLKCGNPIQVVPDFNLIEAELASNIGELMDAIENEKNSDNNIDVKNSQTNDINEVSIDNMELKLVDISRKSDENNDGDDPADGRTKVIGNISDALRDIHEEDELSQQEEITDNKTVERIQPEIKTERKRGSKKGLFISIAIVIAIIVIVTLFIVIGKFVGDHTTTYEEYYSQAENAYESLNTADALKYAKSALEKATNTAEKIEVRKLMCDIYLLAGDKGEAYAENLEALIALGALSSEYYIHLAEYYTEHEEYEKLTEMLINIEDESILGALADYVVAEPKADYESGDYNTYMAVTLTAEEGYEIRYTLDSRNPSVYGDKYKEPIQITTEGETIIKAIAINELGVESKIVTFTYDIELTGSSAPVIKPSGGQYTDYTKITVEVPEGCKAYYTWDGTEPTEESTEYTGEIDMPRKINVLKVILVDQYGIKSEVAQESYNLQIPSAITINEAISMIETGLLGTAEEGYELVVTYDSIIVDNNNEYYIIYTTNEDESGNVKSMSIYAVNTYDKTIHLAQDLDGGFLILEEEVVFETPDEAETTENEDSSEEEIKTEP